MTYSVFESFKKILIKNFFKLSHFEILNLKNNTENKISRVKEGLQKFVEIEKLHNFKSYFQVFGDLQKWRNLTRKSFEKITNITSSKSLFSISTKNKFNLLVTDTIKKIITTSFIVL